MGWRCLGHVCTTSEVYLYGQQWNRGPQGNEKDKVDKGKGGTVWKTLLCLLSPQPAKIGSKLQAGASRVATVQIFQTEKPLDYKSLLQRCLHVGWQQHPPCSALTSARSRSCASRCREVPDSQLRLAGGTGNQTVLLIPPSPQRLLPTR